MFKIMTGVLNKKSNPTIEEINKIPSYIFCNWLSGNPNTIGAANQINFYFNIPIENQYNMIKSAFAGKLKYIPYPKNQKELNNEDANILSGHYNISLEKAREYLEYIDKNELKELVELYKDDELKRK